MNSQARSAESTSTPIHAGGYHYQHDDPQDVADFADFTADELRELALTQGYDFTEHPAFQSADDEPAPPRYSSIQDVIDQAIAPALKEGTHDLEAIAREAFEWRVDENDAGQQLLNTAGFEQVVTGDEFWEIVERHEIAGTAEVNVIDGTIRVHTPSEDTDILHHAGRVLALAADVEPWGVNEENMARADAALADMGWQRVSAWHGDQTLTCQVTPA